MNKLFGVPLITVMLALSGCVVSVSPLYNSKDLVYDPSLLGVWARSEDATSWTFSKAGDSGYKLVVTEDRVASPFIAHLVELGSRRFLDVSPDKSALDDLKQIDLYKSALISGHVFLRVTQIAPTLQMRILDDDWVKEALKKEPLAHQEVDGEVILTAPTPALQSFLLLHWDTEGAWGESSNLKRR